MSKFLAHCTPKKPKKEQGLPTTNLTYIPSKITKISKAGKDCLGEKLNYTSQKKWRGISNLPTVQRHSLEVPSIPHVAELWTWRPEIHHKDNCNKRLILNLWSVVPTKGYGLIILDYCGKFNTQFKNRGSCNWVPSICWGRWNRLTCKSCDEMSLWCGAV